MTKTCFISRPFKEPYNTLSSSLLKPAIAKAGLSPVEVDRPGVRDIYVQIKEDIKNAAHCVFDISEGNPNVMHEIGMAQTLDKSMTIICEAGKKPDGKFPFNISNNRIIIYNDGSPDEVDDELFKDIVEKVGSTPDYKYSPIVKELNDLARQVLMAIAHDSLVLQTLSCGESLRKTVTASPVLLSKALHDLTCAGIISSDDENIFYDPVHGIKKDHGIEMAKGLGKGWEGTGFVGAVERPGLSAKLIHVGKGADNERLYHYYGLTFLGFDLIREHPNVSITRGNVTIEWGRHV